MTKLFPFTQTVMINMEVCHSHKFLLIVGEHTPNKDYKYLLCVYGVDRKICHEGHCSASRGLPSDAEQ